MADEDIYEGYSPEAREYFEQLDYVYSNIRVVWCECDLRPEKLRKLNKDIVVCTNGVSVHNIRHILSDEAVNEFLRKKYPPPKMFLMPKPSWLQRLLDRVF